eukprot:gene15754-21877_t
MEGLVERRPSSSSPLSGFGVTRVLMLAAFILLSFFTYFYIDTRSSLHAFLLMVQEDRWGSLQHFVLVYAVAVVLLFPCMVLQVVSGALYGFWFGLWVSWVATSIGQSLSFLLGRYLFRQAVKKYLHQSWPSFPIVDAAIKKGGWKLVCLLRLSPVLPYNVLNYALALTPVSFGVFTWASSVATIPWTVFYVYIGTFSNNLMDLANGKIIYDSDSKLAVSILSLLFIIVTSVYGYIVSHRAILSVLKEAEDNIQPGEEGYGYVHVVTGERQLSPREGLDGLSPRRPSRDLEDMT